jgi:hypothetical protein
MHGLVCGELCSRPRGRMRESGFVDLSDAAAAWRRDGFVVLPGYLDGHGLEAAQRDLAAVYPGAEEYHAAPGQGRNRVYTGDEFGGIIAFPFATITLCRLVVHERLVVLAAAGRSGRGNHPWRARTAPTGFRDRSVAAAARRSGG